MPCEHFHHQENSDVLAIAIGLEAIADRVEAIAMQLAPALVAQMVCRPGLLY